MGTSAVASLLSSLTDHASQGGAPPGGLLGGPMPALTSANLPRMAPPPNMGQPDQNILGSIHDKIGGLLDSVRPSAPAGFEGLLSPDEIKSARPSFLQSLIGGPDAPSSADRYRSNLENIVKMKGLASQTMEHRRVMDARRNMATLFPMSPDDTIDQTRTKLAQMYAYAMAHGDEETMKDVGSRLSSIFTQPHTPSAFHEVPGKGLYDLSDPKNPKLLVASEKTPHIVNAQEGVFEQKEDGLYNAATGQKWTGGTIHPVPLAPAFTPQTITGPEGTPVVAPFNTKAGTMGAPVAAGKPTSHAQTAQNMATEALLRSSVSEMNNADKYMREYEAELVSGKKSINGLSQFMGGLGNAFTHDDPASRAIQNTALTALNKINPDLARYIRRGLSFAEGEAGISKRPSDFRTKMATFLSTAASGASPEMITDIQGRRHSITGPLNDILSANPVGGTSKGSGSATGVKTGSKLDAYRHLLQ